MRKLSVLSVLLIAAIAATPAFGSEIIGRNVSRPTLSIGRHGRALVTYRVRGVTKTLMASRAINARAPSTARPQVKFKLQYGAKGRGVCPAL